MDKWLKEMRALHGSDPNKAVILDDLEQIHKDYEAMDRLMIALGLKGFLQKTLERAKALGLFPEDVSRETKR